MNATFSPGLSESTGGNGRSVAAVCRAVEGVAHASADPASVFNTYMLVYFLSAAIICTAIGIWGFRHWREFARAEALESA